MADLIDQFKAYYTTHPNLTQCWLTYLELKKRHYGENVMKQCEVVLTRLAAGCPDLTEEDIVRILLYKRSV